MSFSYDSAALSTELNLIRLTIGDTDSTDYFLDDDEIAYVQSDKSSFNARVAKCCDLICAQLASKPKYRIDGYSEDGAAVYERYKAMAKKFGALAAGLYPYTSSITQDDKDTYEDDTDLVDAKFTVGIHDNP